jgi:hypothetical protein
MSLTRILAVGATLGLGMSTLAGAEAGELAGLHEQRREGDRICMTEHFHHGSSAGERTQKEAEAVAVQRWAAFVAFEYRELWADYAIAASKTMQCSLSGTGWGCEVDARPCKRAEEQRERSTSVKSCAKPPAKTH